MKKALTFKLIATLLVLLVFSACSTTNPSPAGEPDLQVSAQSVDRRIASGADDTEEVSTGAMYAPSGRLEIVKTESYGNQTVGLRFTNITVPKGAKITNAQLFFTAERVTSAPTNVTVKGLKDARPFPTTRNYLSSAAKTTALNSWPPNPWTEVGVTDAYKTGNIANVVQELVNASSWRSGGALAFVIYGGQGDRSAESFESSPSQAVRLVIQYDPPAQPQPTIPSCLTSSNPTAPTATRNLKLEGLPANAQVTLKGKTIDGGTGQAVTIQNNGTGLCLSGGKLITDARDNSSWDSVYHEGHNFLNLLNSKEVKLERVAGDTAGDALGIVAKYWVKGKEYAAQPGHAANWTLAHSYFRHVGDDIVDNDMREAGTIDNVLVDWAHTGIACRAYAAGFQRVPGKMTVKNTLFAIKPQLSSGNGANNYYSPFKWDTPKGLRAGSRAEYRKPCPLALNNVTVYMAPRSTGVRSVFATTSDGSIDPVEFVTECTNVTFLYGGTNYPNKAQLDRLRAKFGPSCFSVMEGAPARAEWNKRRDNWFARHDLPGFEHIQKYRYSQPAAPK